MAEDQELNVDKDQCTFPVHKVVVDTSAVSGVNAADFPATAPIEVGSPATTDPALIQAWIDANIDYSATTTVDNTLDYSDPDPTADMTNGGFRQFWAFITQTTILSWSFAGEGFVRVEVDVCNCGEFAIADEDQGAFITEFDGQVSVTLVPGLHNIRLTFVDISGLLNNWIYDGEPFQFFAEDPGGNLQILQIDCDGNLTTDGTTPVIGELIDPWDWTCPIGAKIKIADIIDPQNFPAPTVSTSVIYSEEYFARTSNGTTSPQAGRNATMTRTAAGRWDVALSPVHPDGDDYHPSFTQEEQSNLRDHPNIHVVQGSQTANGFSLEITTGDNGGTADAYVDTPFSLSIDAPVSVVTGVS